MEDKKDKLKNILKISAPYVLLAVAMYLVGYIIGIVLSFIK